MSSRSGHHRKLGIDIPPDQRALVVVVVDDRPEQRRALSRALEAHGWIVHPFDDLDEALRCACDLLPDVVLTGLDVGGVRAGSLTRPLKTVPGAERVQVVGLASPDEPILTLGVGLDHVLCGPFEPDQLDANLRAIVGARAA